MTSPTPELVVLLDERANPIGTMDKQLVHTQSTPLHLAFSCFAFDPDGRVLFTRRALSKRTWPGVWTGSCCGHPGPGESTPEAITRRMKSELGMEISELRAVLPEFRYRAVASDGIVENEVCPVYFADATGDPTPEADEVMDWHWLSPEDLVAAVAAAPFLISPWTVLQVRQLADRGLLG